MMNRNYFVAIFCMTCLMLSSCSKKTVATDFKQGSFDGMKYFEGENRFSTDIPIEPNVVKKITGGDYNYYSWKTIKKNIKTKKEPRESFSGVETISVDDYADYGLEGQMYLRTEDRILNNYLFFFDDRRVLYISVDDFRFPIKAPLEEDIMDDLFISFGQIKLLHLELEESLNKGEKNLYRQAIRGYYTVKGDKIEFHFDGRKEFFVKGSLSNDNNRITFDSISTYSDDIVKSEGLNDTYVSFLDIFGENTQPIFEVPVEGDIILEQRFQLNFGLLPLAPPDKKVKELRKLLMPDERFSNPDRYDEVITKITYEFDPIEFIYVRKYYYSLINLFDNSSKDFEYTEVLDSTMFSW